MLESGKLKKIAKLWKQHRVFQTRMKSAGPGDAVNIREEASRNWREICDTLDRLTDDI